MDWQNYVLYTSIDADRNSVSINPDDTAKGEKILIFAIMYRAIIDTTDYMRPRPPNYWGMTKRNHRKLLSLFIALMQTEELDKIKRSRRLKKLPEGSYVFLLFLMKKIVFTNKNIDLLSREIITKEEQIAWEAREFFDIKNKLFCLYCDFIDLEPEYFIKRVFDYFRRCDDGMKIKISDNYHDIELESKM
jgi:hypothetical protein